jgi:hypothetical protein
MDGLALPIADAQWDILYDGAEQWFLSGRQNNLFERIF